MSFYTSIYYSICERKKQAKSSYGPFSGLHEHHIIPKHRGGSNLEYNLTYLTVREHIIAHFLLWKIYGFVNDLRALKMLGAKITTQQRKTMGLWCVENKIGIHGYDKEQRKQAQEKGHEAQVAAGEQCRDNNIGIHGYTRKQRQLNAKKAMETQKHSGSKQTFYYWSTKEGQNERASMGGKANTGKKCMYKLGNHSFIRVKPEHITNYLSKGYILGSPISPNLGKKTNKPSPKRRKVTDGKKIYDSVQQAAQENNITPSAIVYRCKSQAKKSATWNYVSDNAPEL